MRSGYEFVVGGGGGVGAGPLLVEDGRVGLDVESGLLGNLVALRLLLLLLIVLLWWLLLGLWLLLVGWSIGRGRVFTLEPPGNGGTRGRALGGRAGYGKYFAESSCFLVHKTGLH